MTIFILDEFSRLKNDLGLPTLEDSARDQDHSVITAKYDRMYGEIHLSSPLVQNETTIVHGTIEFCRAFRKKYPFACPGVYSNENTENFNKYAVYLRDYLLNDEYYILPWGEFCARGITKPIFIRPNSGLKQFTGFVITPDNFNFEINSKNQIERVDSDLLCVISPVRHIKNEYRFVIIDSKVIAASHYSWEKDDLELDIPQECYNLAEIIAALPWQADYAYICDIALVGDGPKVVELNSFSSSGLYNCDTKEIVKNITISANKEFFGGI